MSDNMTGGRMVNAPEARHARSYSVERGRLLQRKCACGVKQSPYAGCPTCRQAGLGLERGAVNQEAAVAVLPIVREALRYSGGPLRLPSGHDFSRIRIQPDFEGEASAVREGRAATPRGTGRPWAGPSVSGSQPKTTEGAVLQRKCDCVGSGQIPGDEESLQLSAEPGRALRPRLPQTNDVPEIRQSHGEALPDAVQLRAQQVFGSDLSGARVHTGSPAARAAARLGARAFASGDDIYFGAGFWRPSSEEGLALIGHELTHVLQQRRGLSALDLKGSGDSYEQEADRAGQSFVRRVPAVVSRPRSFSSCPTE